MKKMFRLALILAFIFAGWSASAEQPTNIEESVKNIAKEFEKTKGVDCMILEKGLRFGLVKEVFKAKFGKEFMKDVTSLVIIDYSKASSEVAETFRKRIDSFSAVLQELKSGKEVVEEGKYEKCYAKVDGTNLSDMMIIVEDKESRFYLYMGGVLDATKMELNL
jgi:hypothetical protein